MYTIVNNSVFQEPISKLKEPENYDFVKYYTIERSDLDVNGHANNLSYLRTITNLMPDELYSKDFRNLEIMYKKECKLGDELACLFSKVDNSYTITIKSKDLSVLHCIIKLWK